MDFNWGYCEDGEPGAREFRPATYKGQRLFVVNRYGAVSFPAGHMPGYLFTRATAARGYLRIEPFEYRTAVEDCVAQDGNRFAATLIVAILQVPKNEDIWREIVERRLSIGEEVDNAIKRAVRLAAKTVAYASLKLRDAEAEQQVIHAVSQAISLATPYRLLNLSFDLRCNDPAVDETIDSARHAKLIEDEAEELRRIEARRAQRDHEADLARIGRGQEIRRIETRQRREDELDEAKHQDERAAIEFNRRLRELQKLKALYPDIYERLAATNSAFFVDLEKARLRSHQDVASLRGQLSTFRALIGQGEIIPDRQEITWIENEFGPERRDAQDPPSPTG